MKVRIQIDTETFVRFWLVVISFALLGWLLYSAKTALIIIGVSFFLALALSKPVAAIASKLPGKSRVGGTAISFVAVVATLGVFGLLVVPPVIEQSAKFADTIPTLVDNAQVQWVGLSDVIDRYGLQGQVDSAVNSVRENASSWAANVGSGVISGIGSLAAFLTATLLVLVLTFLMLVEGPMWVKRVWLLYKDKDLMKYHQRLSERMYNVVTSYVTGQILVSAIGALSAGLAVFVISLFTPIPANLAMPIIAVTFVLSLIPMFGATIAGVLAGVLLALNDVPAAIIYVIYFVIYQQVENNVISPAIQSKTIDLTALVVLTAATVGTYMFGIAGGIIAIPIAGCIKILVEEYVSRAKEERHKRSTPVRKVLKKISQETERVTE
ncbi:AI-2E family transporter [Candidatus Saccharibacteria bacterium]|nr:AI-2E family transporter [Candidatus Saccharibacteria bacterium]